MNKLYEDGPVVLVLRSILDYRIQYKYSVHSSACLAHPLLQSIHIAPYMATHSYFPDFDQFPICLQFVFGGILDMNWQIPQIEYILMNFRPSSNPYSTRRTEGGDPVNPKYNSYGGHV